MFFGGLAVLSGALMPVAESFVTRMKHEFAVDGVSNRRIQQMLLVYVTSVL